MAAPATAEATATAQGARAAVFKMEAEDFPAAAVSWIKNPKIKWEGPVEVPLDEIDFTNRANWRAYSHNRKIAKFMRMIRDGDRKPVVLISVPGQVKKIVADGHHRGLAYYKLQRSVKAFVGHVPSRSGPWDKMHAMQRNSGPPASVNLARKQKKQKPYPLVTQAQLTAVAAILGGTITGIAGVTAAILAVIPNLSLPALNAAVSLVSRWPRLEEHGTGPGTAAAVRENEMRQAAFLMKAYDRLVQAENDPEAFQDEVQDEERYLGQHFQVSEQRKRAGGLVDSAADTYGDLLGWYKTGNVKHTVECEEADGKNFYASKPPLIGYPGFVHANCRCAPGKPFANAPVLLSAGIPFRELNLAGFPGQFDPQKHPHGYHGHFAQTPDMMNPVQGGETAGQEAWEQAGLKNLETWAQDALSEKVPGAVSGTHVITTPRGTEFHKIKDSNGKIHWVGKAANGELLHVNTRKELHAAAHQHELANKTPYTGLGEQKHGTPYLIKKVPKPEVPEPGTPTSQVVKPIHNVGDKVIAPNGKTGTVTSIKKYDTVPGHQVTVSHDDGTKSAGSELAYSKVVGAGGVPGGSADIPFKIGDHVKSKTGSDKGVPGKVVNTDGKKGGKQYVSYKDAQGFYHSQYAAQLEHHSEAGPVGLMYDTKSGALVGAKHEAKVTGKTQEAILGTDGKWHVFPEGGVPSDQVSQPFFKIDQAGSIIHDNTASKFSMGDEVLAQGTEYGKIIKTDDNSDKVTIQTVEGHSMTFDGKQVEKISHSEFQAASDIFSTGHGSALHEHPFKIGSKVVDKITNEMGTVSHIGPDSVTFIDAQGSAIHSPLEDVKLQSGVAHKLTAMEQYQIGLMTADEVHAETGQWPPGTEPLKDWEKELLGESAPAPVKPKAAGTPLNEVWKKYYSLNEVPLGSGWQANVYQKKWDIISEWGSAKGKKRGTLTLDKKGTYTLTDHHGQASYFGPSQDDAVNKLVQYHKPAAWSKAVDAAGGLESVMGTGKTEEPMTAKATAAESKEMDAVVASHIASVKSVGESPVWKDLISEVKAVGVKKEMWIVRKDDKSPWQIVYKNPKTDAGSPFNGKENFWVSLGGQQSGGGVGTGAGQVMHWKPGDSLASHQPALESQLVNANKGHVEAAKFTAAQEALKADEALNNALAQIPAQQADDYNKLMAHYKSNVTLTAAEKSSVQAYQGSGYGDINAALRKQTKPGFNPSMISTSSRNHIKNIDSAMKKWQLPHAITVGRKINNANWLPNDSIVGQAITEVGFSSTSFSSGVWSGHVKMWIHVPAGFNAVHMNALAGSKHPSERELLLPRGTKFITVEDKIINGVRVLVMEALNPEGTLQLSNWSPERLVRYTWDAKTWPLRLATAQEMEAAFRQAR